MTDRELFEKSAKAAGIYIQFPSSRYHPEDQIPRLENTLEEWNPLTDDGDALRLAVKLQIEITTYPKAGEVGAGRSANIVGYGKHGRVFEYFGNDAYAATRRAIVRAAAEIGKEMK